MKKEEIKYGSMQSQYKEQHLHGVGIGCELIIAGFAA